MTSSSTIQTHKKQYNLKALWLDSLPSSSDCNAHNLYSEVRSTAETNWLEGNILSPSFSNAFFLQ